MNVMATTVLVGAISALPMTSMPSVPLGNPVDSLSVSAGGLNIDISAEGVQTSAAENRDFELELMFKSGTPIRVRL